jgi:transcriptional regulator with XRE-family HTH domain
VTEVSDRLRDARQQAGLTVEEISARTKINVSFLGAIERGEFERLPGVFYTRAFIRTYARELHLSPDEIVQHYDLRRMLAQQQAPVLDIPLEATENHQSPTAIALTRQPRLRPAPTMDAPTAWSAWPAVALPIVLLVVISVINRAVPDHPHETGAVGTTGVTDATHGPTDAAVAEVPPPKVSVPEKLTLEIHPSGPVWVAVTADTRRVVYRLLNPGEHVTVEAGDALSFRVGNAAAFAYDINGIPGRLLGGPGEVRDVEITRENYRTFAR